MKNSDRIRKLPLMLPKMLDEMFDNDQTHPTSSNTIFFFFFEFLLNFKTSQMRPAFHPP